jgi:hypothetical protein
VGEKDNTIIIDGAGSAEEIEARVIQVRQQIENTTSAPMLVQLVLRGHPFSLLM